MRVFSPLQREILERIRFRFEGATRDMIVDASHESKTPWRTVFLQLGLDNPINFADSVSDLPEFKRDAFEDYEDYRRLILGH
jgi:hypothetical protein